MKRTNVFRSLAGVGAAMVLAVSLTACGGSPDDASKDDFCDAIKKVGESGGDFDDQKDAVADLSDVGTPDDIDDDAREGFELMVDAYDDADNEDDLEKAGDDLSDDDKEKGEAFTKYMGETCSEEMGAPTEAPSDTATDVPTDMSSDMPTEIPSDMPTEIPSDLESLMSDMPTDLESLMSDLPTEMQTN